MMFANRTDAGRQLARALNTYRGTTPLVLGLPRGGVVVAAEIARALEGSLDVMLVKKLRAPDNPEFALGAVTEDGRVILNTSAPMPEAEIASRLAEIRRQRERYRRPRAATKNRTVILTDDGLATGATMEAAIAATTDPARLIVAVPVSPPETAEKLSAMVDEFICLETPQDFQGVGQFYTDFTQVSDDTVIQILEAFA